METTDDSLYQKGEKRGILNPNKMLDNAFDETNDVEKVTGLKKRSGVNNEVKIEKKEEEKKEIKQNSSSSLIIKNTSLPSNPLQSQKNQESLEKKDILPEESKVVEEKKEEVTPWDLYKDKMFKKK